MDDDEEEKWQSLIAQPEIQRGFSRLADKIRADIAAGKFEEGGFVVEEASAAQQTRLVSGTDEKDNVS